MFLFDALIRAMRSTLDLYLSFHWASEPLLALALLSLSVFVVMWPLYKFGDKLLAGEKKRKAQMQGELDSIATLQSGQRKYFYTQEIYSRHGYSPLYSLIGLVGLAIQMPFFFAAYHMLHEYQPFFALAAGPFLDLAKPDGLLQFSGITVNLMPLLMTLINLLAAYYYAESPEEKKKIWLFPALFLVLLYGQPVALVFYWSMNNVFSLLKNLYKTRKRVYLESGRGTKWWAIPELNWRKFAGDKARSLNLALFFFALFLTILYFVESDKDKKIAALWFNSALFLLFYLTFYSIFLELSKGQLKNQMIKKIGLHGLLGLLGLLRLSLLLASLWALFRLLQLGWMAGRIGTLDSQALHELLSLRMQIQALRPIAWLLCFTTLLSSYLLAKQQAQTARNSLSNLKNSLSRFLEGFWAGPPAPSTRHIRHWQKSCFKRYLLSFGIVLLAMFWTVPARVIASDPATFEGNSNFLLLAANLVLFCLLPLALMALLYLILSMKVLRYYVSCLAAVAAWFFSLNVLVFSGNYGPMEFTSFRNPLQISANSIAGSALLLGFLLLVLLPSYQSATQRRFDSKNSGSLELSNKPFALDRMLSLFLLLHLVSISFSSYKLTRYHLDLAQGAKGAKGATETKEVAKVGLADTLQIENSNQSSNQVKLSPDGRNVIILMLDKFMGGLLPEVLEVNPELARRLDGFIFYPNTVSQAQRTYGGFHPIVGGSEYTVDKMNANPRSLATDIIEAFTMIPKAFRTQYSERQENFASYFVNVDYVVAPRARGTMLQYLAEEEVQIMQTERNYELLPNPELARGGNKELKWQNFLAVLGLFQGFGPIFRRQIYNHGKWMGILGKSDTWASLAFWLPYIELLSLERLFEAAQPGQLAGSYVLYHNQLPHNTGFVGSQDYFAEPENFNFPLPEVPAKLLELDAQNGNRALEILFLANYETLYIVADWLDKLKEQGLYDNSLIYFISDHGSVYFDPSFEIQGREGHRKKSNWHSLYMRKDFAARGAMRSSDEFRTIADLPAEFLPLFGIYKNPYSGKTLEPVRSEPIPLYAVEGIRRSEELVGNDHQYYIHEQYNLHNRNIFDDANWELVP